MHPHSTNHIIAARSEDDSASGSKHADQLQRVPLIGKIAYNLRLDGLVRVLLPEEQCEIAGGHYKVCRV
jgi:hypothetical protein